MRSIISIILCLTGLSAFAQTKPFVFDDLDRGEKNYPRDLKSSKNDAHSLSVFWWNIREGGAWSKALDGNPLEQNLEILAQSELAPEVMVLGEFVQGSFQKKTESVLSSRYPFQIYIPYARLRNDRGFKVYSKYAMEIDQSLLDWSPMNDTAVEQAEFKEHWRKFLNPQADRYYERVFADVRIHKANSIFHVVPVHLLNPWLSLSEKTSKADAAVALVFAKNNPHYRQVERLMIEKIAPLAEQVKREHSSLVMVGDFNVPDEVYGIIPTAYHLMRRGLDAVVAPAFSLYTFPAISSDMSDQIHFKIDHAFIDSATNVLYQTRIPFRGSDHYPIAVKVQSRR